MMPCSSLSLSNTPELNLAILWAGEALARQWARRWRGVAWVN